MQRQRPEIIANFFLEKSFEEGHQLTPIQIIKLTYLAHGWHLGLKGEPLLGEPIEAWKYGPVVPSLYHLVKDYGRAPVDQLLTVDGKQQVLDRESTLVPLLERVWEVYGKRYDGMQLSTLTHQDGTPWHEVWEARGGKTAMNCIIPNDLIQRHFKEKADASRTAA